MGRRQFLRRLMQLTPAQIGQVQQGYRFCSGDGLPVIHPDEPEWKKCCSVCFDAKRTARYCSDCGDPLPGKTINNCRAKGYLSAKCLSCLNGWTAPHLVHGVKLPRSCSVWFNPSLARS